MKKIILCGYNWPGCKSLEKLLLENNNVYVYTHKSPWHICSLADFCKLKNVAYTYDKISVQNLPFKPDLIISIYYRYLIGQDVINRANGSAFNLHPSLLPKYKGCSSITWAMINGEEYSGFSYHYLTKDIDSGNIIFQSKEKIYGFDTQETLYNRIMFNAMDAFNDVLRLVSEGYKGLPQIGESSFFPRGCPYDGEINPSWDLSKKHRFIRAMTNPPYPPAKYRGNIIHKIDDLT